MNLRLSHCLTSIIGKQVIFVHDLKSMNAHLLILYQNLDMEIWKKIKMLFFLAFLLILKVFSPLPPTGAINCHQQLKYPTATTHNGEWWQWWVEAVGVSGSGGWL